MPLFDFTLHPLEQVMPWNGKAGPYLSWFSLTDGYYAINTGAQRHYQYTSEILDFWRKKYPSTTPEPVSPLSDCCNYQIVRLYEDVLDILPNILAPIPDEAHALLHSPDSINAWQTSLDWVNDIPDDARDSEALLNLRETASRWFWQRTLTSMHLQVGPDLNMWRHGETIHFSWDHTRLRLDSYPNAVWTATTGTHAMPFADFMCEIESFHARLMDGMAAHIHRLQTANPIPHVRIDMKHLLHEHEQRRQSLTTALRNQPDAASWSEIFAATSALQQKRKSHT